MAPPNSAMAYGKSVILAEIRWWKGSVRLAIAALKR
jgi:hypothetical protein